MPTVQDQWVEDVSREELEAAAAFFDQRCGPPPAEKPVSGSLDLLVLARHRLGIEPPISCSPPTGRDEEVRTVGLSEILPATIRKGSEGGLTLLEALTAAAIGLEPDRDAGQGTVERASRALFSVLKSRGWDDRACTFAGEIALWEKQKPTRESILSLLDETIRLNQPPHTSREGRAESGKPVSE